MKRFCFWKAAVLTALAGWTAFSFGCYADRRTGVYGGLLGGELERDNAILEESGHDEAAEAERLARLEALAGEQLSAYRVNPGDEIQIRVYGHDDLDVTTKVSPDGNVGMLFLGQVAVGGHTIAEARDAIEEGLAPYVRHPVVGVTVLNVSGENVTVSGACGRPGLYPITSGSRLADAYAMAGGSAVRLINGMSIDVANLEYSLLIRDGEIIPVDFQRAIEQGNPLENVRLKKNDYIFIAQRMESSVTVCGAVEAPQKRLYESPMGLIETLTACGWMKDTHWSHVIIIRDGLGNPKMYKVDVDGILAGKCHNVFLKPNDIVYVPKDNISEYNVFVRKLLPTAQLVNLLASRVTAYTDN